MDLRVLAVGDVCGVAGLQFLSERLKALKAEQNIDFCVVNGENANVVGVTPRQADDLERQRRRRDAPAGGRSLRRRRGRDHAREPHLGAL